MRGLGRWIMSSVYWRRCGSLVFYFSKNIAGLVGAVQSARDALKVESRNADLKRRLAAAEKLAGATEATITRQLALPAAISKIKTKPRGRALRARL